MDAGSMMRPAASDTLLQCALPKQAACHIFTLPHLALTLLTPCIQRGACATVGCRLVVHCSVTGLFVTQRCFTCEHGPLCEHDLHIWLMPKVYVHTKSTAGYV